ncbi:hypothetical protein PIB30_040120 [Stylosanthes scabra]|uniref:Uncharacterized protein n=1 Tax=Stylosanthes scabra TaxID=79078 RepID=A0ABU6SFB5_9FABA|nr:hypothetical protein [Stylosanthes scabra]
MVNILILKEGGNDDSGFQQTPEKGVNPPPNQTLQEMETALRELLESQTQEAAIATEAMKRAEDGSKSRRPKHTYFIVALKFFFTFTVIILKFYIRLNFFYRSNDISKRNTNQGACDVVVAVEPRQTLSSLWGSPSRCALTYFLGRFGSRRCSCGSLGVSPRSHSIIQH